MMPTLIDEGEEGTTICCRGCALGFGHELRCGSYSAQLVDDSTATFGSHSSSSLQSTTVATILTSTATKGSMKIEVACTTGMKVGQKIRIGTLVYEDNVIASFGSINLTTPLARNHDVGDGVVIIDEASLNQIGRAHV